MLAAACSAVGLPAATHPGAPAFLVLSAQSAPDKDVQAALARIGANLFSPAPQPAAAIEELRRLLAADPELAEAHMLLGIAYRAQGSPEMMGEAVGELRQAIVLKPSLIVARLTLARVYLDLARPARAIEELELARAEAPDAPQILSLLGESERHNGNPARAVDLNRQALKQDPGFTQARYYLGLALLDQRQHAQAIQELEAVAQSGTNPAEAYYGLGSAYLAAGRHQQAIAALTEALRAAPDRPEAHLQLARAYRLSGQLVAASRQLERARPASGSLVALYGQVDADLHLEEGLVRMQQGRLDAAARAFEQVLALDATNTMARERLAEVRKRMRTAPAGKGPGAPR